MCMRVCKCAMDVRRLRSFSPEVYIYVHIFICIHIDTYIYIYMFIYTYVYICRHMYTYIYTHLYAQVYPPGRDSMHRPPWSSPPTPEDFQFFFFGQLPATWPNVELRQLRQLVFSSSCSAAKKEWETKNGTPQTGNKTCGKIRIAALQVDGKQQIRLQHCNSINA